MAKPFSRERAGGKLAWYVSLKHPDGEWKASLLKGCKTEKQAQKFADELEAEYARLGKGLESGRRFRGTFHELCEWAFAVHFSKLRGAQADRSRFNYHAGPTTHLGKLPVERITTAEIQDYLDAYAAKPTVRGKPPSAVSINRIRAMFSSVFTVAHERKIWPADNPVLGTKKLEGAALVAETLAAHEVIPVLAEISDYWRGCCAVGILAGLRKGEILPLRKADVDLERRVLLVQRSHEFVGTKGSKGKPEAVPIPEVLVPYLEPWLETLGPLLFPSSTGEQRGRGVHMEHLIRGAMVRAGFCEWYDHKCRRAGCGHVERHADDAPRHCPECGMKLWAVGHARRVTFHGGRHTCATLALKAGASLHAVQRILRHKDPRLTANTYGHLTVGDLALDLNRVNLPGAPTPGQRGSAESGAAHGSQHPAPRCIVERGDSKKFSAPSVRERRDGDPHDESESLNGLNLAGLSCGADRDRTGDLCIANVLPEPPPAHPELHLIVTTSVPNPARHPVSPQKTPSSDGFSAPSVRASGNPHWPLRDASREGSPPAASGSTPAHRSSALLTVREAGARLRVSTGWIYREVSAGRLGHVRVGGSGIRVPVEAIDAYLRSFPGLGQAPAPSRSRALPDVENAKPPRAPKTLNGRRAIR